ncbi:unnamed protein product [Rotaria sp. Silwood1]|nr:unnamed protein product [Rotaria sp. Silwood1]
MKKSTDSHNYSSSENARREFGISIQELEKLMQKRGHEGIKQLNETYGGLSGIEQKLKTNLINGLSGDDNDLSTRMVAFGRNELPPKPPKTFLRLVLDALLDVRLVQPIIFAIILFALSFYYPSGETFEAGAKPKEANVALIESLVIIIAVIVVVLVTAFNDLTKERQFRDLQSKIEADQKFNVIRGSQVHQIPITDIVVGDICQITHGDLLPADGIVVQSNNLKVDESSLTGEIDLIKKHESEDPFLLSGTHIMEGNGKMLVLAVGTHSQMGMIYKLLDEIKEENNDNKKQNAAVNNQGATTLQEVIPDNVNQATTKDDFDRFEFEERPNLQRKLTELPNLIAYAGRRIFILIVLVLLVPFVIKEFVERREWSDKFRSRVVGYLVTGITLLIVSVPEGVPLVATISLAYTVKKMMKDNNLVRHLDACETIGNVTTICVDKTGILTTNCMTVVQVYVAEKHWKNIENSTKEIIIPANTKEFIIEGISVNTNYSSKILSSAEQETLPKQIGNKTECSLLGFVNALEGNYDEIRTHYPEEKFIHVYKFNSLRKNMSTVIRRSDSTVRMYTKGATEIVLKKCKTILNHNGDIIPFSTVDYDRLIETIIEPMASDGLRTICLAYRDFSSNRLPDWNDETSVVDQLTCICICGIGDSVGPEVPIAITKCRNAGIAVKMVTEDNINSARLIAFKCGIITHNDNFLMLESKEFNRRIRSETNGEVEQNLFDKVWPYLCVLARSSPQDKYVLVRGIMASKINPIREIVAVTGNGTNDAPALRKADIGFAMGIQGTDTAKQASDIILIDDNLNSIVKAIMWSRNIYDSIKKSLQFQLTVNIVVVLCAFIGACIVRDSPLRGVQMLWIYLIMNILALLALIIEVPTEELLTCEPYRRIQPIISRTMMKKIIGHTIYQLVVMLFILLAGPKIFNIDDGRPVDSIFKPSQHFTMIFNVFVLMTLFNAINCRKIHDEKNIFHGISKNSIFYGIWIITFIVQIVLVQYSSFIFSCVALTFEQWIWCLLFGVSVLLWNQMLNLIPVTRNMPILGASNVYELALRGELDREEQSRPEASLTKDKHFDHQE